MHDEMTPWVLTRRKLYLPLAISRADAVIGCCLMLGPSTLILSAKKRLVLSSGAIVISPCVLIRRWRRAVLGILVHTSIAPAVLSRKVMNFPPALSTVPVKSKRMGFVRLSSGILFASATQRIVSESFCPPCAHNAQSRQKN